MMRARGLLTWWKFVRSKQAEGVKEKKFDQAQGKLHLKLHVAPRVDQHSASEDNMRPFLIRMSIHK